MYDASAQLTPTCAGHVVVTRLSKQNRCFTHSYVVRCSLETRPKKLSEVNWSDGCRNKADFCEDVRDQYREMREEFMAGLEDRKYLTIDQVRAKAYEVSWSLLQTTQFHEQLIDL